MAIRYLSKNHSAEDPGGLIHEALAAGEAFQGPAEDLLLSWTLRLAPDQDARTLAATLLERYGLTEGPLPPGAGGRLVELLRQTATARLDLARPTGRRRGGRDARKKCGPLA